MEHRVNIVIKGMVVLLFIYRALIMARIAVMFLLVTPGTKTLINEAKIGLLALKQSREIINCVSYVVLIIKKVKDTIIWGNS